MPGSTQYCMALSRYYRFLTLFVKAQLMFCVAALTLLVFTVMISYIVVDYRHGTGD